MTVEYEVHDNGRGPAGTATIQLAPDQTIASLTSHGHTTMGAPANATFSLAEGHAVWKSEQQSGEKTASGPTFFIPPVAGDFDPFLLGALLKNNHALSILPAGVARLETVGDATVTANGLTKHLVLYAITGFDLLPKYLWAEDDGTFFGELDGSQAEVEEGWESAAPSLLERQNKLDRARDATLAAKLAHKPPPAGFALIHARVLDLEHGQWKDDQTVITVGDLISAIGPSKTTKVPPGAETIDVNGKAILPGLWDMHAHLVQGDGLLDIASGVTTARDVANNVDRLDNLKARFDDGSTIGPHVFRAGWIEGRGPNAAFAPVTAETPEEAKAAVELYAARGYDMIKIYSSVKTELVPVIIKEAHARDMGVTGHVPVHMLANEAVRAGYDGIEHVNMLFLNFLADHDTDTRTTKRFTLVGENAAALDLSSKPVRDFVTLLHDHHTVVDPTFGVFEGMLLSTQGKVTPGLESIMVRLPAGPQRFFLMGGLPHPEKDDLYRRSWEKVLSIAKVLHDAGVTTVVGTDTRPAGLMYHHELDLMVRGGLTPIEALRDATIVSARVMKVDQKTGSIAVGKVADLYVVDGDPLTNIRDVANGVMTFRGGTLYRVDPLFESVGIAARGR